MNAFGLIFASPAFPCVVLLGGLAFWLSIAVYNNLRDAGTNVHLLGLMFRMDLIREDPNLGNGLQYRARMNPNSAINALRAGVAVQIIVALLLWIATAAILAWWFGVMNRDVALATANLAIVGFLGLWTFFLCGGLWFGYWMKMPQVQQVHLSLFTIALIAFVLIGRVA